MQIKAIKLYKFIIDFLKTKKYWIIIAVPAILIFDYYFLAYLINYSYWANYNRTALMSAIIDQQIPHRFDVEKDCDVGIVTGITGWTYAERELTSEQQDACALRDLERAKPIVRTKEMVGDIPISLIELYAQGKGIRYDEENLTPTVKCIDGADSHRAEIDCLFSLESEMQSTIQSLIASIIDKDLKRHQERYQEMLAEGFTDENTEFTGYAEFASKYSEYKEPLQNWYASATGVGSLKATKCKLDTRASWGGTSNTDDIAACFIQEEAKQIFWLLDFITELEKEI